MSKFKSEAKKPKIFMKHPEKFPKLSRKYPENFLKNSRNLQVHAGFYFPKISLSDRLWSGDCTTDHGNFLRIFLQCRAVPDHDRGRPKQINAWFLYTHMVYLLPKQSLGY
jgi:hypothetical protein